VQRILGRADGLCNKKIALAALSLTKRPILHAAWQFDVYGVQTLISFRPIFYNLIALARINGAFLPPGGFEPFRKSVYKMAVSQHESGIALG
jgi:hypothetical protein